MTTVHTIKCISNKNKSSIRDFETCGIEPVTLCVCSVQKQSNIFIKIFSEINFFISKKILIFMDFDF
jgi:hypothetical protein